MVSSFADIIRPTPVVDELRARANIAGMAAKARRLGLELRPHFKTHQSVAIGTWFRDEGVRAITVSSLGMAAYFAADGWDDITVAFPYNPREAALAGDLAGRVRLGLLVDGDEGLRAAAALGAPARVWIKIDTGYGRAGVSWKQPEASLALAEGLRRSATLEFAGILTHNGATYQAKDRQSLLISHAKSLARMRDVAALIGDCPISLGDTPACVLAEDFEGASEIRPGNFVFFDLMQRALGVCNDNQIALAMACPVVGVRSDHILLYGGAVHFSKDFVEVGDQRRYGCLSEEAFGPVDESSPLIGLSQGHGTVRAGEEAAKLKVGGLAWIYPAHSCLSADLHSAYRSRNGACIPKWDGGR